MKTVILACLVALFSFQIIEAQLAPDFTVTDVDGVSHSLYADYLDKGTTVMVKIFFVACPPCNNIAPSVQNLYEQWGEGAYDVQFIELSNKLNDDNLDVSNYKSNHGLTFPSVSADGGSVPAQALLTDGTFGPAFGTPLFVVIAPDGTVTFDPPFSQVSDAIAATGATGSETQQELTTSFNLSITNPAINSTPVTDVEYLIGPAENPQQAGPIDLTQYETVEAILEAYPTLNNPHIYFRKDSDALNNVSAADIALMVKHILGIDPFTESYKVIASDINADNNVSAVDLGVLSKIVLGLQDFPDGNVWQFLPESVELSTSPGNTVNFNVEGIKVGNVN
jgi:thiol-disulfide isomerase/thioredoxin